MCYVYEPPRRDERDGRAAAGASRGRPRRRRRRTRGRRAADAQAQAFPTVDLRRVHVRERRRPDLRRLRRGADLRRQAAAGGAARARGAQRRAAAAAAAADGRPAGSPTAVEREEDPTFRKMHIDYKPVLFDARRRGGRHGANTPSDMMSPKGGRPGGLQGAGADGDTKKRPAAAGLFKRQDGRAGKAAGKR